MSPIEKKYFGLNRLFQRLKKTDRLLLVGFLIAVVLTVFSLILMPRFFYQSPKIEYSNQIQIQAEPQPHYRHPLTGISVYEEVQSPQVFGVMIDNHEDAWPPSGVEDAFLVIEAPVEGGISRMLAFFSEEQEVEKIGPVRSARPYFLDWANELDAVYTHVGGSNTALDLIASGGTFDLNQYWWGDYFWRSTDRYAPHNVYTSTKLLNDYYGFREKQGEVSERLYGLWKFKDHEFLTETVSTIQIDFSASVSVVDWVYDSQTQTYERSQFHKPHLASSGKQIKADNVAIVITEINVMDSIGRLEIRTQGEGQAFVFQDGQRIEALWKKPSQTQRLTFYDLKNNEEIFMNAGVTWIEVISSNLMIK
ncbi:MAG: hypothetical protein UT30_C0006G0021 [Candidatus Uhrbacteria bacterium GW2011_GWF2_39_13]|uniref:PT repeat-containing protein n=1 Tax=Candidatus Uhrbacteria bacterium GW2011_GWF2_39_13 TaxID=1618995 RepID=A0A0G0QSB5_9BACT|nr:MAG: hypothetical protein UT30_C0006G0021 [Candidatus Uhrbacteria bacterium GW2011_GWF2_39_13]